MNTWTVTIEAFDRISVKRIEAETYDEAKEKALKLIGFKIKVTSR